MYEMIKICDSRMGYTYKINNISSANYHCYQIKVQAHTLIGWSNMQIILFA